VQGFIQAAGVSLTRFAARRSRTPSSVLAEKARARIAAAEAQSAPREGS
jgi:hypothetical protein